MVDRLVVSDTVPKEVNPLDPIVNGLANRSGIAVIWVVRKRVAQRWDPQRGQVRRRTQEPPESEAQLSDDLAVDLGNTPARGSDAGRLDVVERPRTVFAREEFATLVPGCRPALSCAVDEERLINRVAEHDLKPADVLVESATHPCVPVVESESPLQVTI